MSVYYNEHDKKTAAWLRQLVSEGHIADGVVDDRDIQDVTADELRDYTQVHLFAGIGGWSYALRLAGWPDDRPVWTGSCPCQPFSAAGKRKGESDERHLWPEMRRLLAELRPATVFGEQVASGLGREWLAGVRTDLEALGYAVGAADLCAAGIGSPHIRQRLFWLAHAPKRGLTEFRGADQPRSRGHADSGKPTRGLGHALLPRSQAVREVQAGSAYSGYWSSFACIPCGDGKTRRIEPGLSPLVDGVPARVVRLRGYGNAIVPQVAATFVKAYIGDTLFAAGEGASK